jgi:hypothetical protein
MQARWWEWLFCGAAAVLVLVYLWWQFLSP